MHQRLLLAAALAIGLSSHALAQGQGTRVMLVDERGNPINATNVLPTSAGGGGGGGGTVTQGTTPWVVSGNGTANSGSNPFFVQVTNPSSPGTVTAAGTNGTQAQAVQGITGGVPLAVSGSVSSAQSGTWTVGLNTAIPTGGNVIGAVTQSGGPWTVSGTVTANLGTLNGAATAAKQPALGTAGTPSADVISVQGVSGGTPQNVAGTVAVSNFPGSQAVTNAGTFAVQNTAATPAGSNTIGSLNNISGTVSLPTGAATSANQTSEITQLTTIAQRATLFSDQSAAAVASSASAFGAIRDVGATPTYSRFNGGGFATQSGTFIIQGCIDSGCASAITLATVATTANGAFTLSTPVLTRYYRTIFTNGATAGTVTVSSSFTAN